jgi:hypothetical protein
MLSNPKKLAIPSNLDLEQLLLAHPPQDKGIKADYLAFICNTLIHLKARYREDIRKKNGRIRLNASILKKFMYSYRTCLNYLIDTGILTTDGSYIVGFESIGYDFTDPYIGLGFNEYIVKSSQYKRTLNVKLASIEKERNKNSQPVKHLLTSFDAKRFTIDSHGANEWIEKSRIAHLEAVAIKYPGQELADYYRRIHEKHDLYRVSADFFKTGNYHCLLDQTGYRFHSALTNLKSELRNFLSFDGKPLVSVDIKNSQPYFSLLLFKKSFYSCSRDKDTCTLKDIHPELYNFIRKTSIWERLKRYAHSEGIVKRYISIEQYKKSVLDGSFYEELAEFVNQDSGGKKSLTRAQAKKSTFTIFFGDTSTKIKHMDEYKSFKRHYPDVAEVFELYKRRPTQDDEGVRYQDLSILLQRIESQMVLQVITKKFHQLYPTTPLLTIHDCVITDVEHKDILADIITVELRKVIGVPPKLTEEYWKPEYATIEIKDDFLAL